MGILSAILALLRSIPAIASLVERLLDAKKERDAKRLEVDSSKRKAEKDAEVDSAIDAALSGGVRNSADGAGEQSPPDSKA